MLETKTGRGSDQFPLRLPTGMRDEIKRLAEENGRSMNSEIIDMLNFSISNSGLNIDQILRMLVSQRSDLYKLQAKDGDIQQNQKITDLEKQLDEYKTLLRQKDGLLMAVCLQIFLNREHLPADSLFLADAILKKSGEIDLLSLESSEVNDVPLARFHHLVRKFLRDPHSGKSSIKIS